MPILHINVKILKYIIKREKMDKKLSDEQKEILYSCEQKFQVQASFLMKKEKVFM